MTQPIQQTITPVVETPQDEEFNKLLTRSYRPDGAFQEPSQFAFAQRVAKMLVKSEMVPEHFRGDNKLANAVIAIDIAQRLRMSPLLVMKQIYMVHGQPGLSGQLQIAAINCSGIFDRIKFRMTGEGDTRGCVAYAKHLPSGETLEGSKVTIELTKKEGWYQKNGSKWQTMPDQMLMYRAAAFWGRAYAPELLMGLSTVEELEDLAPPMSKPLFRTKAEALESLKQLAPESKLVEGAEPTPPYVRLREKLVEEGVSVDEFLATLFGIGIIESNQTTLESLSNDQLAIAMKNIETLIEKTKEKPE